MTKQYVIYDVSGRILRTGGCADDDLNIQVQNENENVMEGNADSVTQKVVEGRIVNKTAGELENDKPFVPEPPELPGPVSFEHQKADISNEQWQNILERLNELERGIR